MADINVKVGLTGAKEFKGNADSLTKSVKGMNAELKTAAAEFQRDQTSVEKVRRVRELLTAEIDKQKASYDQLQLRLQETIEKTGEDSKETAKLQKEVDKAKASLDGMQNTLSSLPSDMQVTGAAIKKLGDDIKASGDKIQQFGKGVEDIGKGMTTTITAPILGIGGAAIAAAKELDEGYDSIITATGATGQKAEELRGIMDSVFRRLPTDAKTAGDAVGAVATRFSELDSDNISLLSGEFVKFAEVAGTDVVSAVTDVDRIMERFGVDTSETRGVMGLLLATAQDTGIDINALTKNLETSGATFKEMGLSVEESVVLLGQFEQNGVDTTAALAGLRKAQQNAAKDGKSLDEALNEQIEAIKTAETQTEALQIAQELFGKKGAAEMTQAIREGKFSLDDLDASLSDYTMRVNDTYSETLDPWDAMKYMINDLKLAGADLANSMFSVVMPHFAELSLKVEDLVQAFTSLDDEQKEQIIKIAALVAAIGPALLIVGKVIGFIGSIVSGIGSLISVIGGAITSIGGITGATIAAAAPIVAIVAAIAAVVAAVVHLWNTNDAFRESVMTFIGEIRDFIAQKLAEIKAFWDAHGEDIMAIVSGTWEFISGLIGAVLEIIMGIIRVAMKVLQGDWKGAWEVVKETLSKVWQTMVTAVTRAKEKMGDAVQKIVDAVKKKFEDLVAKALTWGRDIIENIVSGISGAVHKVGEAVSGVAQTVKDFLGFSEPKKGPLSNFHTYMPDMMNLMAQGIRQFTPEVEAAVNAVAGDISILQPQGATADEIYSAVKNGAGDAEVRLYIGERELGRVLRDMGVQMA